MFYEKNMKIIFIDVIFIIHELKVLLHTDVDLYPYITYHCNLGFSDPCRFQKNKETLAAVQVTLGNPDRRRDH